MLKKSKKVSDSFDTERDELTNVLNKDAFITQMKKQIVNDDKEYLVIVTNIVGFRIFNEYHGHDIGDRKLCEVASLLSSYTSGCGIVGRIGADIFSILIAKEVFSEDEFVDKVIRTFADNNDAYLHTLLVAGVYEIKDKRISALLMCDRALSACRHIEKEVQCSVFYYNDSLLQEKKRTMNMLSEINVAIERKQFIPYLQPQCNADGELVGAEVLCRWVHPEKGVVPPVEFIDLCEKSGFITKIDHQMMEEACKIMASWKQNGQKPISLSVNLSSVDFETSDVIERVTTLTDKYGLAPDCLRLEITETALMEEPCEPRLNAIQKLRDLGYCIEMDDFGSGYSSLGMLSKLDVDVLKLDMSFLRELNKRKNGKKMLEVIHEMVKKLSLKSVVEGVETQEQLELLESIGYSVYQGYLFSKPLPVEVFEAKYLSDKR